MVRHIVFFKLNNKNDADEVKEKLLTLKDGVKEVKDLEVGINFSDEERAYDIALIVDLENKEALEAYANDKYHQEVIKYLKIKVKTTKIVDYLN